MVAIILRAIWYVCIVLFISLVVLGAIDSIFETELLDGLFDSETWRYYPIGNSILTLILGCLVTIAILCAVSYEPLTPEEKAAQTEHQYEMSRMIEDQWEP